MQNKKEMNELYKQETGKGEARPSLNIMLSLHQLSSIWHGVWHGQRTVAIKA